MSAGAAFLAAARQASGLSQQELAHRAGTSRTTLSAYEHGAKSPTVDTFERLLAAAGHEFELVPRISFPDRITARGKPIAVPTHLPQLAPERALATVTLPLHLDWSTPLQTYRLADRHDRGRVYELVLREGTPHDVLTYIDGVLLMDLWPDLVLPHEIRSAWSPLLTLDPGQPIAA